MKILKLTAACIAVALYCTTAFGDVAGSSSATGSWTSTGTYSSTITLVDPGGDTVITDITVGVNIDHSWSSDVSMFLSDGTNTVEFIDNEGDSDDYDSSTLGKYLFNDGGIAFPNANPVPNDMVIGTSNALNGAFASSDATWTLTITDTTGGDGAFINGWNLSLTTTSVIPEPTTFAVLGIAGSVALMRRRR